MVDFYIRSLPLLCEIGISPRCLGCWLLTKMGIEVFPNEHHRHRVEFAVA